MSYEFATGLTERERATYSERLLRLRELLLSLPRKAYDHSTYKNDCGTSCCALGWAASTKKAFPSLRLTFKNIAGAYSAPAWMLVPTFDDECVSEIDEADRYFGPGAYEHIFDAETFDTWRDEDFQKITPKVVAKRIAAYVEQSYGYVPTKEGK